MAFLPVDPPVDPATDPPAAAAEPHGAALAGLQVHRGRGLVALALAAGASMTMATGAAESTGGLKWWFFMVLLWLLVWFYGA